MDLHRVEKFQRHHVVLAVEQFETAGKGLRGDEVAEQKDHASLGEQLQRLPEGKIDVRPAAFGLEIEHLADEPQGVPAARAGGHVKFDPVAEHEQSHLVAAVPGAEGQQGGQFGRGAALGLHGGAEGPRGGDVDQQQDVEFPLLDELFDVGFSHAGGDVPVDGADIVVEGVLPDFVELDAASLEGAAVRAAGDLVDDPRRADLQQTYLLCQFNRQHGCTS